MICLPPGWQTGAVLQHSRRQKICGTATPRQPIKLSLQCTSGLLNIETISDAAGDFSLEIPPQPPSGPWILHIADGAGQHITLDDLWFGHLLLFAGQSNVGWPLFKYPEQLEQARQDLQSGATSTKVRCYQSDNSDFNGAGYWLTLSATHCQQWPALLYYFSRYFQTTAWAADPQLLNEPSQLMLGLVDVSWPGSAIDAWTAAEEKPQADQPWQAGALFSRRLCCWLRQPFAALIWYQGEQDAMGRFAHHYGEKLQHFYDSCRQTAGHEFPFFLVQIAGFGDASRPDPANGFVQVRDAQQAFAASTATCKLVSAADLGAAADIHPPFKEELARRLAFTLVCTLASPQSNPGLLQAALQQTSEGVCLVLPALPTNAQWQLRAESCTVTGFYWQNSKGNWSTAEARLSPDRRRIIMQLPKQACQLGYGITAFPQLSLYTTQGLPLLPQRWPLQDTAPIQDADMKNYCEDAGTG